MANNYTVAFCELKQKAGFKGSDSTLHKYRKFGLLDCKREGRGYLFSSASIKQLQLIPELKKYSLDENEIKETFEKVPLDLLLERVGKLPPDDLYKVITGYKVNLDLKWPHGPEFP